MLFFLKKSHVDGGTESLDGRDLIALDVSEEKGHGRVDSIDSGDLEK